jgi:ammonium transporter, Amt family
VAAGAVLAYSLIVTTIIAVLLKVSIGLRVDHDAEQVGIDEVEHAEVGYELTGIRTGHVPSTSHSSGGLAPSTKVPASAGTEG